MVQLVLTHCDRLMVDETKERSHENFAYVCAKQVEWIQGGV